MKLSRLWLTDFRSYTELDLSLDSGLTVIVGPNGIGKTNLVEAVTVMATLKSFRGATNENLIRRGAERAIIRAEGIRDEREVLIELELSPGRSRAQVNRQRLARTKDLLGALRVTVFAPDDLALVKEGPALRRGFLDDLTVALQPSTDALFSDFDRVLRQRNALLKSVGPSSGSGRSLDESTEATLDIWDQQFAVLGERILDLRYRTLEALVPQIIAGYRALASDSTEITATYRPSWGSGSLAEALDSERNTDLRRRLSTIGPHRDEVSFFLNGFASRNEASQGEQRTLALAMRMAAHRLTTETIGEPPLLLLDDVLSELDGGRSRALLENLPPGQTIITSAGGLPADTAPDQVINFPLQHESAPRSDATVPT